MSEDADIEILGPEIQAPRPRRLVGFKALGVATVLAIFLGAGGGAVLSQALQKKPPNIAPLTSSIESLTTENKTLKAQIARLQRDIKALPKAKSVDLSGLETRVKDLENAAPQSIDPDLVARLEALNEEGSDALDLSDILARLEALENRPAVAVPVIATPVSKLVAIDFPESEILAVLKASEASGGWLKKALKKHISVQSEDNPRYLVEVIVESLEAGNNAAAISAFDKLPAEAKAAGQNWRKSIESQ